MGEMKIGVDGRMMLRNGYISGKISSENVKWTEFCLNDHNGSKDNSSGLNRGHVLSS
jgi:hypothetical protein